MRMDYCKIYFCGKKAPRSIKLIGGTSMGNVLKRNRYRLVDNHSFELPLPMKFELYKENSPVAEYEISPDHKVNYRILTKYKEQMLTPINRIARNVQNVA